MTVMTMNSQGCFGYFLIKTLHTPEISCHDCHDNEFPGVFWVFPNNNLTHPWDQLS
jgi:hypothetical protein